MNYLITGSSGFVGSNLCIYLENEGHKVYQCSRNLKDKNKIYFDLGKEKNLEIEILKKIDVLVHCAYNFNFNSLEKNRKINVSGSEKIFIAANKFNIKIIYISSISSFKNSYSIYGKIKKEIEDIANKYNAIIIRPGLIYSKQSQGGMFGSIVNLVKKIPILPLIDKGEQKLYMCKLEILCELIHKLSIQKKFNLNVIIAANKEPIMFKEIINIIKIKYNKKRLLFPFPSVILLCILKLIEKCNIKIRVKSDSLKSILHPNNKLSFTNLDRLKIYFPPFKTDY